MSEPPLLELRAVTIRSGTTTVLDGVSLSIAKGATTIAMGQTGSGKSSLIKVAAGLVIPGSGELFLEGRPFDALGKKALLDFRRRSGFVFQDAALWANQSLYDNIAFPLRFHSPSISAAEADRAVRAAASMAGCRRDLSVRPADISAGEAKLVGLARALVLDPEILFLDDPFSRLDEGDRQKLSRLLAELRDGGKTMFLTGGTAELASRLADFVAVLREGRLGAFGSYDEAANWSDPRGLGLPSRLLPRARRGGLVAVWEDALADEEIARARPDVPAPEDI